MNIKITKNYNCDVLVAGGGVAGVSAAIAAARNGSSVILLEKSCMLGGLATAGLITYYLPLCNGLGKQVTFGIAEELLKLSIKHCHEEMYPKYWLEKGYESLRSEQRFMVRYNPHMFAFELEKLLVELKIKILYDTTLCYTKRQKNIIDYVVICNKDGFSKINMSTVIDATGDASVCTMADEKTEIFTKKNVLAAWYYYFSKGDYKLNALGFADAVSDTSDEKGPEPLIERRFTGIDAEEITEMTILSHEQMLKNIIENRKTDFSYIPVTIPSIPQLRMTKRLVGIYTMNDSESFKSFKDSIGLIGDWRKKGPIYEIPFSVYVIMKLGQKK